MMTPPVAIRPHRMVLGLTDPKTKTPPKCPPLERIILNAGLDVIFRPQRFWFPPEQADFFELIDFSVGRNRQLLGGPFKCSTFRQWPEPPKGILPEELERFYDALHASDLTFDTAQVGMRVSCELRNLDPVTPREIYCTVEGLAAL